MPQPLHHDNFTLTRTISKSPAKVYQALTDPELRQKWFVAPPECVTTRREYDFRVGGEEIWTGQFPTVATSYQARFFHIEPDHSMVYTYDMHLNGEHHSLSLVTLELQEVEQGTELVYRETVTFFDGTQSAQNRSGGVGTHFTNLVRLLDGEAESAGDWACPHSQG